MDRLSRRQFTLGAAAALLVGRAQAAPERRPTGAPAAPSRPTDAPPQKPALSPAGRVEAEARVQVILARYGDRFSPAEKAELMRLSTDAQPLLEALRAFPLDYADEP